LLNNLESKEDIAAIADRIMETFARPCTSRSRNYLSPAVLESRVSHRWEDAEELIKNADLAMYASKDNGKNQYSFCTRAMKTDVQQNATQPTIFIVHWKETNCSFFISLK
jgi:PleD family two-component response regulator